MELQKYTTKIYVPQTDESPPDYNNAERPTPDSNNVPPETSTTYYDNAGFIHDTNLYTDVKTSNGPLKISDTISYIDVKKGLVVTEDGEPSDGKLQVVGATSGDLTTKPNSNNNEDEDNEDDHDDDEDDERDYNVCSRAVLFVQTKVVNFFRTNKKELIRILLFILFVGYFVYFGLAMKYRFGDEGSWRLLIVTAIAGLLIALNLFADHVIKNRLENFQATVSNLSETRRANIALTVIKWILYIGMAVFMIVYLITEVFIDHPRNLISLAGIASFMVSLYITSTNPARVNWHPVFWGMSLQFIFALMILRTTWGRDAFKYLGDRVTEFLSYAASGATFVFDLDQLQRLKRPIFAFTVLPIVIFVGSMTGVLYFLGAIQVVIKYIGRFLSFCLGTSAAESLNASANIFLGMTEAPLIIKNYIADMTKSELNAIMTGGFATIAGSVLGAYIGMGIEAKHLLSASVMSAPAALAMAKLTCPETNLKKVAKNQDFSKMEKSSDRNIIEAAANGAMFTIKLVANIAVNLIAFISILAFMNATLTWFGNRVGIDNLTFELITSYLLYPVAFLMGADANDCQKLAELIGVKTFTNEFVAYARLSDIIKVNNPTFLNYTSMYNSSDAWEWQGTDVYLKEWKQTLQYGVLFEERSIVIATYALCGFANFGSMGITLGGMGAIAPKRKTVLSKIVLRAMIAGNVACFLTACIAGLFFEN